MECGKESDRREKRGEHRREVIRGEMDGEVNKDRMMVERSGDFKLMGG